MKPLYFSALFLLLLAVSHASRFDINLINHDEDQNHYPVESNGGDSLIRLPTENKQPQPKTTSSTDRLVDLTELMNRRPVYLRNRFRFRYVPRRCHNRLSRFVKVDPKDDLGSMFKKQVDAIQHRHVAGEFIIPLKHYYRLHHDHDHDNHHSEIDRMVEMKRGEEYVVKEEYDGEWKGGRPYYHHDHHDDDHHNHHDHDHHHKHHDHEVPEKKENYIIRKIRKFLSHF